MIVITGNSDAEGSAGSGGTEQAGTYVGDPERLQHGQEPASAWVQRWSHLVPANGRVLDVACGQGRHAYWFYQRGHAVTVVDRSQQAVASIAIPALWCEAVVADIEQGSWPFAGRQFDAVVVTNYLWRPLLPTLLASIAPGGVLLYETFASGNETAAIFSFCFASMRSRRQPIGKCHTKMAGKIPSAAVYATSLPDKRSPASAGLVSNMFCTMFASITTPYSSMKKLAAADTGNKSAFTMRNIGRKAISVRAKCTARNRTINVAAANSHSKAPFGATVRKKIRQNG